MHIFHGESARKFCAFTKSGKPSVVGTAVEGLSIDSSFFFLLFLFLLPPIYSEDKDFYAKLIITCVIKERNNTDSQVGRIVYPIGS